MAPIATKQSRTMALEMHLFSHDHGLQPGNSARRTASSCTDNVGIIPQSERRYTLPLLSYSSKRRQFPYSSLHGTYARLLRPRPIRAPPCFSRSSKRPSCLLSPAPPLFFPPQLMRAYACMICFPRTQKSIPRNTASMAA